MQRGPYTQLLVIQYVASLTYIRIARIVRYIFLIIPSLFVIFLLHRNNVSVLKGFIEVLLSHYLALCVPLENRPQRTLFFSAV